MSRTGAALALTSAFISGMTAGAAVGRKLKRTGGPIPAPLAEPFELRHPEWKLRGQPLAFAFKR
jgi:hypothetical protein